LEWHWDCIARFLVPQTNKMSHCKSCSRGCVYRQCVCFKSGHYCQPEKCGCTGCQNQAPTKSDDDEEEEDIENEPVFLPVVEKMVPGVKIVSWNMHHFSAFTRNLSRLKSNTRPISELEQIHLRHQVNRTIKELEATELPDILVLQELPRGQRQERIQTFLDALKGDAYEHTEDEESEHVFIWSTKTIKTKYRQDKMRQLIKDGVQRPISTMQFQHLGSGLRLVISSVHLKSGGGEETINNFKELVKQYPEKAKTYYGESEARTLHVLAGDFNLNPHHHREIWSNHFICLGNEYTKTSCGNNGYDFFMLFKKSTAIDQVGFYQRELVQRRIKTASLGVVGTTDHDPVILTVYPYRTGVI
jgi:endonuclease/exonuclease/phosphatase family metal-dependent hydrolase